MKGIENNSMENFEQHSRYCEDVLPHVSRTFALGVKALRGDLKRATLAGYLLCRIADTIEDDLKLDWETKCAYLTTFSACFQDKQEIHKIAQISQVLTGDINHVNLVKNIHSVFSVFFALPERTQFILKKWIVEMVVGMKKFTQTYPKGIRIKTVSEFKEYCYFVAGTVGHLLTDLWKEHGVFISETKYKKLSQKAGFFGEGLQSINILKDISWDISQENAHYLPEDEIKNTNADVALKKIIKLANENLQTSLEYITSIPIINLRIRFFCILPLLLAFATLREIKRTQSLFAPEISIKISRKEVKSIYKHSFLSCFSNTYLKHFATKCLENSQAVRI